MMRDLVEHIAAFHARAEPLLDRGGAVTIAAIEAENDECLHRARGRFLPPSDIAELHRRSRAWLILPQPPASVGSGFACGLVLGSFGREMTTLGPTVPLPEAPAPRRFSPNVAMLGYVSMLTAMSSAMIYGLLPVFLVKALGVSIASVGLIEGVAEAGSSLIKIASGAVSDRIGRRKPLVVFGYTLSAITKTIFPIAGTVFAVLTARVIDRMGKGIRDAPRDAFLADLTTQAIRGAGFGLRLALAITGFVVGPLLAVALMKLSGDDFRLVFWIALIPAYLSIIILLVVVKELPFNPVKPRRPISRGDILALPSSFWRVMVIASLLSLARFSQAFLVLKAHNVGVDAAYVPLVLVVMYLVFSVAAYPFGMLADHMDRRLQLAIGTVILICAGIVLASASTVWVTALGAAVWGLQLGVTQGLLGAAVADAAPDRLRGTAFGIYEVAIGSATFVASAGAGALWAAGGPAMAFGASACVATIALLMLAVLGRKLPNWGTSNAK
jgi:MFS family permease